MRTPTSKRHGMPLCLTGLAILCLLTHCTPRDPTHTPPPVPVPDRVPSLTPEEQLELFNCFLERG
jgi:hypothetical protein